MAKKKPIRRRRRSPAPVKRRRRRTMSESPFSLAEAFDFSNKESALRIAGEGALGAALGSLLTKNVTDPKQKKLYLLLLAGGMVLMKHPNAAAGVAGVIAYDLLSEYPTLKEGPEEVSFFDVEALGENEPLVLDQYGNPLALADGSPAEESYIPEYLGNSYYSA